MGFDLDFLEMDGRKRRYGKKRDSYGGGFRSRHRHMFAWLFMAGGVVVLGLILVGILNALGVMGWISSAYFAAALAVLPDGWHDEFKALPGIVHVLIVLGGIGLIAGIAGELFD